MSSPDSRYDFFDYFFFFFWGTTRAFLRAEYAQFTLHTVEKLASDISWLSVEISMYPESLYLLLQQHISSLDADAKLAIKELHAAISKRLSHSTQSDMSPF